MIEPCLKRERQTEKGGGEGKRAAVASFGRWYGYCRVLQLPALAILARIAVYPSNIVC